MVEMTSVSNQSSEESSDESAAVALSENEPPQKKIKRDVIKEAEQELERHNEMLMDGSLSSAEKLKTLTNYLDYLFENNVNTLQFETDLTEWAKTTLLSLLEGLSETTVELYGFLCSVLRIAPTMFESVFEKVFGVLYTCHTFSPECDRGYESFMEKLAITFERLRRFPKMVAKLLRSVRDNIMANRGTSVGKLKRIDKLVAFVLPQGFLNSYSTIVSCLSVGQIMDLWTTLNHNLQEECIKGFNIETKDTSSLNRLLTIVVELTVYFLNNIKVVDHSIPRSTVEKVDEMLQKMYENSLVPIGKEVLKLSNVRTTRSFLKLLTGWGHLHQMMSLYNAHYCRARPTFNDFHTGVDLSPVFPFLTKDEWIALSRAIEASQDNSNTSLIVNLVGLKLQWLTAVEQGNQTANNTNDQTINGPSTKAEETTSCNNSEDSLIKSCQDAAKFIWNNRHFFDEQSKEILSNNLSSKYLELAVVYMQHEDLTESAKSFLENTVSKSKYQESWFHKQLHNVQFQSAIILECLDLLLNRAEKMKFLKRSIRVFLRECLNKDSKRLMIDCARNREMLTSDEKNLLMKAVKIVNESIEVNSTTAENQADFEPMPALLTEITAFLSHQEFGQFPIGLKSLVFFACSLPVLALLKQVDCEILEDLVCILSECGQQQQGNEAMFHLRWDLLFERVQESRGNLTSKSLNGISAVILQNVYLSPKTAAEFGEKLMNSICDQFDVTTSVGNLSLSTLDYIVKGALGPKTKTTPVLVNHAKKLTSIAISKLSNGSIISDLHSITRSAKKKGKSEAPSETASSDSFVSCVAQICYLLLKGKPYMSTEDATEFTAIVIPYLQFAVDFLNCTKARIIENVKHKDDDLQLSNSSSKCLQLLSESLKSFHEFRDKLSEDFLLQVWYGCVFVTNRKVQGQAILDEKDVLLKTIFEVASEKELQTICDSFGSKVSEFELRMVTRVLNSLLEATIAVEKKRIRRTTIELCLFKCLEHIQLWKESAALTQSAVPYLQFQTALLSRRKPMASLQSLAVCFTSITALPLDKIDDVSGFKTIFLTACDLLNSISVHRLDVLAFRTHIFLQCFQYLVEVLVMRADQRNKLTDEEISDLRHCGYSIERICQSAKSGRKEFARISPYLVVMLLQQFEKTTVYPTVKNPLLNACNKLLDMCDDRSVSHVNSMLTSGSREIFKTVYDLYKNFYQYKGKV